MSAFKRLDRKDSYTSVYNSQKNWTVRESEFDTLGIKFITSTDDEYIRDSINHLYYSQFNEESSNRFFFENYLQYSFDGTGNRQYLTEDTAVISIPSKITGTNIVPSSFKLTLNPDFVFTLYVDEDYINQDYTAGVEFQYVVQEDYNQTFINIQDPADPTNTFLVNEIFDDGEGNLVVQNSEDIRLVVGNIIYAHGLVIIANEKIAQAIDNQDSFKIEWRSNLPIYTKNYNCRIKNSELNHTLNKTTFNTNSGEINQNINTKSFTPYFTTVGLYNDVNELIAVAKTSQAIPKSKFTDMTINIKIDMPFGVPGDLEPFNKLEGLGENDYVVDSYISDYFI